MINMLSFNDLMLWKLLGRFGVFGDVIMWYRQY